MSRVQAKEATAVDDPLLSPESLRLNVHNTVRRKAVDLLMRREHAVAELQKKLNARDYDANIVAEVIEQLLDEGLVSDARFTEAFVRYRCNNGHGPRRIQSELHERGVSEKIQAAYLDIGDSRWFEHAAQVRSKRFGDAQPENFKERARQARFLQYRGFTSEQIREVLDDV
ncbi:MAG: regulatory protein RecX [Gammaproteobacteria bacterium]|nr:regulatory protein RecX [Gammaproteobacteria bacterium]